MSNSLYRITMSVCRGFIGLDENEVVDILMGGNSGAYQCVFGLRLALTYDTSLMETLLYLSEPRLCIVCYVF